ncbi:MAG: hypothetical protein C7B45_03585 [Sulfobacillus acidophilus]|uniref:Uncharacterized protein n=1 Tax=Sulfobacillus acidophilus TaxID=53633 RepID=A0A2T2WLT0_9FIRM|nr:MAG: hypothetical protein C7B45_03585 [Sulfobacillus acidophilus]
MTSPRDSAAILLGRLVAPGGLYGHYGIYLHRVGLGLANTFGWSARRWAPIQDHDRTKGVINNGEKWISSADLEDALIAHSAVS